MWEQFPEAQPCCGTHSRGGGEIRFVAPILAPHLQSGHVGLAEERWKPTEETAL